MNAVAMGTMIDVEGFDREYETLFRELTVLARALGAGSDAEDVAQDALVDARAQIGRLRDPAKLRPWVRRIAVRGACRARSRRFADLDAEHVERLPAPDPASIAPLDRVDVQRAIAGLPDRERLAVTLVFGLGYGQDEAAELMGIAPGTLYSSLWRVRRKLARLLATDESTMSERRTGR